MKYEFKYNEDDEWHTFKNKDQLIDYLAYCLVGECEWRKK